MSIFSNGVSGLNAAQIGQLTTSHNIANASTQGYSRQQIVQGTNTPMFTGAGFIGQGTNVQTVQRVYNNFLGSQVLVAQTGASAMESYLAEVKQIDNLLADPSAGLSPALSEFFKGVQDVAANPASVPGRQSMISTSQALIGRFQALDRRLGELRDGVNSQITSEATLISSYAKQIAEVNQNVVVAQAGGAGRPANDLLDRRDQLIADLNKEIRVTTLLQSDGTYSVFIGNGQPLVVGTLNYTLQAVAAPDDPARSIIALRSPTGSTVNLPESLLAGGKLGGLIAFRSESLDPVQNGLGRIALTLAQNFNDQHRLGQDLTGALGGNYFDVSLAGPAVQANASNSGSGAVTAVIDAANIASLSTSDYRLTYNGGASYTLTRLADNVILVNAAPLPASVDGFSIAVGGAPVAGDSFLIQPTRNGAGNLALAITDPRSIAAAAPIRTAAALGNSGTATISPGTVNAPPPPNVDLTQTVTISFTTPTTFNVTGTGAGLPALGVLYAPGSDIGYNGWTARITGKPAAGDTFTVAANASGVADNRNAVLLGALQTQTPMVGGTASYQSAYSQIISQVGSKTRQVEVTGEAQQSLADQATAALQSLSGVNLDEEAANLLRYQQAYQASAKVLAIAGKLFEEILALGR